MPAELAEAGLGRGTRKRLVPQLVKQTHRSPISQSLPHYFCATPVTEKREAKEPTEAATGVRIIKERDGDLSNDFGIHLMVDSLAGFADIARLDGPWMMR